LRNPDRLADRVPILHHPDRRQHRLRERPAQHASGIETEPTAHCVDPALDDGGVRQDIRQLDRVAQ